MEKKVGVDISFNYYELNNILYSITYICFLCITILFCLGKAVDFWFLGVHPDYRGNKIANFLTKGVLPLVKAAGFKYGTIEATSAFTSKSAAFNHFEKVYEIQAKDWSGWKGKPLYVNAKAPHGVWTFWVKDLQKE